MSVLSWGKPKLFAKNLDKPDSKWIIWPTPVEDSTELTTTKGDKTEAKIEGGENEDVRYGKNTYALAFNVRSAKGRKKPVADSDGVIEGNWAFVLQPEDPTTQGFVMRKSTMSVEDSWTAADGGVWAYSVDALKDGDHKQVEWGVITVTKATDGSISKIECDPIDEDGEADKFEVAATEA